MNAIMVIVEYDSGSKRQRFMLPADVSCDKLSRAIALRLELPAEDCDEMPTEYRLRHKEQGRGLSCTSTLEAAHIKEDDVLQLEPYQHQHSQWQVPTFLILMSLVAFSVALFLILSS